MSWKNVRSSIVAGLEALTPATTRNSAQRFKHVKTALENTSRDRVFAVVASGPSSQIAAVSTTTKRYLTEASIVIRYMMSRERVEDEDRVEEDVRQITDWMLTQGNHHADFCAFVATGDTWFDVELTIEDDSNSWLRIDFVAHHV